MSGPTRPGRYGFHAKSQAVSLPTVSEDTGYTPATIADPQVANALGKQHGFFGQYHDLTVMKIEDFLDVGSPALSRGVALTYPESAGLANLVPVTTPATIGGDCRTTFDLAVLDIYALASANFAPNARTYFYGSASIGLGDYPIVRVDVVGLLDPPTPAGSEAVLGGVETDAADVIANLTAGLLGQTLTFNADLAFTGAAAFGDISCTGATIVGGVGVALDVKGDGASAAAALDGNGTTGLAVSTTSADAAMTIENNGAGRALTVTGPATFDGAVFGGIVDVNGDIQLSLVDSDVVAKTTARKVAFAIYEFVTAAGLPALGQMVKDSGHQLIYDDTDPNFVHYSPNGVVYATGDQEAATGMAASQTVATTSVAVVGRGLGSVRVIVEGQFQVNSLGSTVTISAQDDQGGFADIGTTQIATALKDTSDANDWQAFRHERVFVAGTSTATLYRTHLIANGGKNVKVKEVRLRVVSERG